MIGGGLSGLTCAYRLQALKHTVKVFEKEPYVGGRMASIQVKGFTIDVGANLLLENYSHTKALARELGIFDEWVPFNSAGSGGILRGGRLSSFEPKGALAALRYPGLSWPARLRLLRYFLYARGWVNKLDFFDLSKGEDESESVDAETYCRAKFGDEITDWVLDPFVRTFHFHGARRISMKYVDALVALLVGQGGFHPRGFRHYMGTLSKALAKKVTVIQDAPVTSVTSGTDSVSIIRDSREEQFDRAVLATPGTASRTLLTNPSPPVKALLDKVEYSSTFMCSFHVALQATPDFEVVWVPYKESKLICCSANEARKGANDATGSLMILGLHEEAAAELQSSTDEAVYELVAQEWYRLFPKFKGLMTGLHIHRWKNALPVYAPGLVAQVSEFWKNSQGQGRIWLCGDYLNHPWVEGSVYCGEKVAASIGPAA